MFAQYNLKKVPNIMRTSIHLIIKICTQKHYSLVLLIIINIIDFFLENLKFIIKWIFGSPYCILIRFFTLCHHSRFYYTRQWFRILKLLPIITKCIQFAFNHLPQLLTFPHVCNFSNRDFIHADHHKALMYYGNFKYVVRTVLL